MHPFTPHIAKIDNRFYIRKFSIFGWTYLQHYFNHWESTDFGNWRPWLMECNGCYQEATAQAVLARYLEHKNNQK